MEYYDAELYNLFNGAPVFKEDLLAPGNFIISPHGLQVVNECIRDQNQKESCLKEIDYLFSQLKYYKGYISSLKIEKQDIMNALYLFTIRIESLTLSGFDAIDIESENLENALQLLTINQYLTKTKSEDLILDTGNIFKKPEDRLTKIRLIQQYRSKIAPLTDFNKGVSPIDHKQANLYNEDFLNATFFGNSGIFQKTDQQRIQLGKRLFNDPLLSKKGVFSCASCHQPNKFFTDGLKLSNANVPGFKLNRNTPTLIHSGYQSKYMFDGRSNSLEDQMLHVFNNRKEFETNVTEIIDKLKENESYVQLFRLAYLDMMNQVINVQYLTDALASYMRSLTGHQSVFDKYMRGEQDEISEQVISGFNLFMGKAKCGTCHFAPTFSGLSPPFYKESELENIGIPSAIVDGRWEKDKDVGRYNFYSNAVFKHFFKTPTIRNVAMTAPYMHNGVFETLEEVMDFYNNGGGVGHGLNYSNQTLPSDSLGLSQHEIQDIITFIGALTDSTYLSY